MVIDLTALQKHIDMLARSPRSNATTLEYLVQCRDEIRGLRVKLVESKQALLDSSDQSHSG